ncbi:MAG TPA: primosomal protein N', partial [Chryseolinea sp.]|nr:primosomal protein N' [Chryseolinea sp.]
MEELFEEASTNFVELLLPVPIPKLFTYRVPNTYRDKIQIGQRAIVQFGDRKILTGVIAAIHQQPPKDYEAKYILELLDDFPVVTDLQFKLFHWIADYYLCTLGEVMNAGLPSGLKLSSESMVQLNPAFSYDESDREFSEKETILLKRLEHDSLGYSEISKLLGIKNLFAILKSLVRKEAIILFEEVREKYRPKTDKRIRLKGEYTDAKKLENLFEALASKPKQEAILLKYLQEVQVLHDPVLNKTGLSKKKLITEELSESSLNTLVKNDILEEFEVVV